MAEFKESAIVPFLECLGYGYMDWRGILDALANFIEPQPIGENTPDGYNTFYEPYHWAGDAAEAGGLNRQPEVTHMATAAHIKAQKKYDAANTRQIHLKLNVRTDCDVLEKLDSVPNKQGYIKELIRADLKNN